MQRVQANGARHRSSEEESTEAPKAPQRGGWGHFNRDVAERIAKRAKNAEIGSVRDLLRLAQKDFPELEDHNLRGLIKRFPDVLGDMKSRPMHEPLPAPARARVKELALAHPTLSYAALAKLFAADPKLKGVLDWSEAEVARLREPSRILPSERKRLDALGQLAAKTLKASSGSLAKAAETLAEQHPGVTPELLLKLAPRNKSLAAAILKLESKPSGAKSTWKPSLTVSPEDAAALKLSAELMTRALRADSSEVPARIFSMLEELATSVGHNDGHLAPHDLAQASPKLQAVMEEVHDRLGKKRLPLADVQEVLPEALGTLAERGRKQGQGTLGDLYLEVARDTIRVLGQDYQAKVLEGGSSLESYYSGWKLVSAQFLAFRTQLPAAFPAVGEGSALSADRRALVAKLYAQMMDGEIHTATFFARAKINAQELKVLQTVDAAHFPRPEGMKSWRTVPGQASALTQATAKELSKDYRAEVLSGEVSLAVFASEHGVTKHGLTTLQERFPKLLPRVGRRATDHAAESAMSAAIATRANALYAADVLISRADLIDSINADPSFTKEFGRLTMSKYDQLRGKSPQDFPNLRDIDAILAALKDEVQALLKKHPHLTPAALTVEMQKTHPSFKLSRVYQLRAVYPKLIPSFAAPSVPKATRRADAERLAKAMNAEPSATIRDLVARWAKKEPRFNPDYLHRLRREFRDDLFVDGAHPYQSVERLRSTLKVSETLAAIIRVSAPGTTEATILSRLNKVLEAEGLPPYQASSDLPANLVARMTTTHGSFEEQQARQIGEVLTEYARAAKKGTSYEELVAAFLHDYPGIDLTRMAKLRALWVKDPERYGVDLSPKGQKIAHPRFIGGWDPERALFEPAKTDPQLALELGRASQFLRMPHELPMLTEMVDALDGSLPLKGKNMLWVTHLLGSTVPMADALRQAGLLPKSTFIVGTPYGTNPAVKEAFEDRGFSVRVPPLDSRAFRKNVEEALDAAIAQHKKNHQPIVVLDDGGLVAEILHSDLKKYGPVLGAFKIVEQTTRGITAAEERDLKVPIINVARSRSKGVEGALIGRAVPAKIEQGLARLGQSVKGKHVTVVGYGIIGQAIAEGLAAAGAKVTVVEASPTRAAEALAAGFQLKSLEDAVKDTQVLVGATGKHSIGLQHLQALPPGAVVVSASSKQLEIDMNGLRKAATKEWAVPCDDPLVRLPSVTYTLEGKKLTVLGNGWPVNFDGDVEDIPAEEIQLTRCAMFAGALQAAGLKTHVAGQNRLIPLDEEVDQRLYDRFFEEQKSMKQRPIGDPSKALDDLRALAERVGA
ncbi:MAG: NAD(P)-dependent oxidoreductase [Myxococcota bacterium]